MSSPASSARADSPPRWLTLLAGVVFGLVFVKFGNPVIFGDQITAPNDLAELIFLSWPPAWSIWFVVALALAGVPFIRFTRPASRLAVVLLGVWLLWQFLSATQTVSVKLTQPTLVQFSGCAISLLFGWLVLGRSRDGGLLWAGLFAGLAFSLWNAWDQHFGGLEATRKAFLAMDPALMTPELRAQFDNPTFQKKLTSTRVFGTFVYPNALAGGILLVLPVAMAWLRNATAAMRPLIGWLAVVGLGGVAAACLYWSGSKSGWLVALATGALLFWKVNWPARRKLAVLAAVGVLGMAAFFVRYAGYFQRGATSVEARFEYWEAAVKTANRHPLVGSGPGTFQIPYRQLKAPESEMARLTHNDYLQQASDSGWPGGLCFVAGLGAAAAALIRKFRAGASWIQWSALAGWLALGLQAFSEFPLYIPALAWPAFLILGWLLTCPASLTSLPPTNRSTKPLSNG